MIINYESGDLVTMIDNSIAGKADPTLVGHGCNCMHIMGAGIALAFRKFPEVYAVDLAVPSPQLGGVSIASLEGCSRVVNIYTQQNIGRHTRQVSYDAVKKAFAYLNTIYPMSHMYIPLIGAGLGGGDWDIISSTINSVTPKLKITVINYAKGVDPRLKV